MRKFTTYIEFLLMTQHYCYVPGKGAYMLSDEPATLGTHPNIGSDSRRLHTLEAPRRIVRFSALNHHDDGMLASLLMEAEGMSYDEACRYIERQVALLPEDFQTSASLHIDTENFGHQALSIETWCDIEARKNAISHPVEQTADKQKQRNADVIAIPRRWIQRVAVMLLIGVCFFASFLGLDDQQTQQQYANVLDLSVLQHNSQSHTDWQAAEDAYETKDDEDGQNAGDELGDVYAYGSDYDSELWSDEEVEAHALAPVAVEEELTAEVEEPVAVAEMAIAPKLADAPKKVITVSPTGKLYYIIVASCPNQQDADRALANLRKQGHNEVGILERDNRFRLYINRFGDKTEAEAYLKVLRQNDSFHSAWLLPVREASLSSIIKNTYNDNQLFMELSHLNQRTERDQG